MGDADVLGAALIEEQLGSQLPGMLVRRRQVCRPGEAAASTAVEDGTASSTSLHSDLAGNFELPSSTHDCRTAGSQILHHLTLLSSVSKAKLH